ncbi:MAG: hypothetical protein AAB923_03205, partial [Patescibacteria group bacterium]
GSTSSPRAGRGSVSLTFDNRSRFLDVDFDEVVVERVVVRDGTNEYRLNGSQVRLKDTLELLAGANIGESGHHIISQGEADKILSASTLERRQMLEDALGLTAYQYKIQESKRKLEKTSENMREVEGLRREIAPHLRFLKKQVEKIEKADALKSNAVPRFREYFKREEAYVNQTKSRIEGDLSARRAELDGIARDVAQAKSALASAAEDKRAGNILELSKSLDEARARRTDAARRSARLEGQIEVVERTAEKATVPAYELSRIVDEGEREIGSGVTLDAVVVFARLFFAKLRTLVRSAEKGAGDLEGLRSERERFVTLEKTEVAKEAELAAALEKIRKELDAAREKERDKERSLFELTSREREVRLGVTVLTGERERLALEEEEFKRELAEAAALFGRAIQSYADMPEPPEVPRAEQEKERRELEKVKIRLEEMGAAGGDETMKEYRDATERESFLERELRDLEAASASLTKLIEDLGRELSGRFAEGVKAVNEEFTKLFALMFDGGSASLITVKEPVRRPRPVFAEGTEDMEEDDMGEADEKEKFVEGLDIALSIPRKRVKSLVMLSGGERALTSIALIFAMSSVNPPPFLVLDETDAALDESNSRRYGDMVEALAKKSQLVLITHNRETMGRAAILYGVTMGGDGVSKILSVKLEEAVKVAK